MYLISSYDRRLYREQVTPGGTKVSKWEVIYIPRGGIASAVGTGCQKGFTLSAFR